MISDNDARIGYGRRTASSSSSRESSPAARQKRSFTPNSDDGEDIPPPVRDNADTASRDGTPVPLIRQAVGFSWQPSTATVTTYEAVLPSNTNAIQFLPGQAPPKKKRKRAKPAYSAQTSRFRLVSEPTQAPTPEPPMQSTLPSAQLPLVYPGAGPYSSLYRLTTAASPSATMSNPSVADAPSLPAQAHSPAASSTLASTPSSSYGVTGGVYNNMTAGSSRSRAPRQVGAPATTTKNKRGKKSTAGSLAQTSVQSPPLQQPLSTVQPQEMQPSHYRRDYESNVSSQERSVAPPPSAGPLRPLRMLTILIEDVRSGVPDHQLAEIQVHLRPAEDPDGGFWANAKEVCEKWQAGPSCVDGPARVYTLRGKYRQFFMRVDNDNLLQTEPCNLGVTKERTIEVVVEAPIPKGKLPLPPRVPRASMSGSDSDIPRPSFQQQSPREIMIGNNTPGPSLNLSSQSQGDRRPKKRRRHSKIHSSTHHNAPQSSPSASSSSSSLSSSPYHTPHRTKQPRHANRDNSSPEEDEIREISPPVFGRLADTVAERDDAIAKFIRSDIEGDKGWPRCMSIVSYGGPKRISDMLWCYNFVESKVKEHRNRRTPSHWDGAPNCWVDRRHIWQVLNLTLEWGEECRTVVKLVNYYGKSGRRYQDPSIIQAMDSTDPPTEKTWKRFVRLLRKVDEVYVQSASLGGN